MARHLPRQPVIAAATVLAAWTVVAAATGAPSELVRYGFDDEVATGPDTLRIFQNARGTVRLSSAFRLGGYRSVEIRDAAHDGDFPELLGRFPLRTEGQLFSHFALLVTNPDQAFNVALAGPERFTLKKDGIGFWLQGRAGSLYHVSDSMPKRLLSLRPFVWYAVDVAYDVGTGTYDLTVGEEGRREPMVSLSGQPNASAHSGSAVEVFSFIGDAGDDTSSVIYYVDDVVLAADRPVDRAQFVAPGRRKLFIDVWSEHRRRQAAGPKCFPVSDIGDLGLEPKDLSGPWRDVATAVIKAALDPRGPRRATAAGELPAPLAAVSVWAGGCEALGEQKLDAARAAFEHAEALWPRARIYPLSRALALAGAKRWQAAERLLASIQGVFGDDLRFEMARAVVGLSRDDLDDALQVLASSAERLPVEGETMEPLTEEYFLVLLWKGAYGDALRYASAMEAHLREMGLPTAPWTEHMGDASFFLGDTGRALRIYLDVLAGEAASAQLYEKLADACFQLGDLDQERVWREKVYGSLGEGVPPTGK